jgi:hypothetical protein
MKNFALAGAVVLASLAMSASADTGVFVGVSYAFGGNNGLGLTAQATSTRKEDRGFAAAGLSYYPFAVGDKLGVPIGIGYQGKNSAVVGNYDLLQKAPAVSAGYANTRGDSPPPLD